MRGFWVLVGLGLLAGSADARQSVTYDVSFPNAVHHEADVVVTYVDLPPTDRFEFRMSRSSPGRYAIHEFAKNVHSVSLTTEAGPATLERPDPYSWVARDVAGTVSIRYTLFADRAGGTYSGIDLTHAHLNIPSAFMWAPGTESYPITVNFTPADSAWKAATQLFPTNEPFSFTAPNLAYFLDSPVELSNHEVRTWQVGPPDDRQTIVLAVHHQGTSAEVDAYADMARKVVAEQIAVFGEAANYDGGSYTFIADYLPYAARDGMEHRNSTVIVSTLPLSTGASSNLGTLSHEFFHQWNVERIRPQQLEPFDFTGADMTNALWFAEGFTSYYTPLAIRRAGLMDDDTFAAGLGGTINAILNSPGRRFFTPLEMSMQAPFVDAATSIDPTNEGNRFLSYYTWGAGIGLALDLTLRDRFDLTLDDFMRTMWVRYGVPETPYVVDDIRSTLADFTGDADFAADFFARFIDGHEAADYTALLATAGFLVRPRNPGRAWTGADLRPVEGGLRVVGYPTDGSPLYLAGVSSGDVITAVDDAVPNETTFAAHAPGSRLQLDVMQRGVHRKLTVELAADPTVEVVTYERATMELCKEAAVRRDAWLSSQATSTTHSTTP